MPATKRPKTNEKTSYVVVWNDTIRHLFSKTELAIKKAAAIEGLMRVFPTKAQATLFIKTLKKDDHTPVSPGVATHHSDEEEIKNGGDTKVSAKELAEDLCKNMVKKNGSRIYGYYKEITSKNMIVVVLDICREREDDNGNVIKQVRKNCLFCQ